MDMEELFKHWLSNPLAGKLAVAVIGIVVIYFVIGFLKKKANHYLKDADSRYRVKKILSFVGVATVIIFLATVFSDRISKLTVAFGMTGAGIAFALKEIIASVASWAALSFGGSYRVGDRVQLGEIKGDVIDIGVLHTTLMEIGQWVNGDLYNGRIVRISNNNVFNQPVINYSADFPFLWDEITFPVKYGSDWKHAADLMQKVADEVCGDFAKKSKESWQHVVRKYRIEEARIDPMVTIQADHNWIEYTIRYIVGYSQRRITKDLLFRRILEGIDRSKNRVRIATSAMEISSDRPVEISLKERG